MNMRISTSFLGNLVKWRIKIWKTENAVTGVFPDNKGNIAIIYVRLR